MTARVGWIAIALGSAVSASSQVCFEHGDLVNLAAVRGAKVSADRRCVSPPSLVCRPPHQSEIRFQSNYGRTWWMIEWPRAFSVSSHRIGYREPMQSMGYRIKVSREPLDEAGWAATKPVFEFAGPLSKLGHDGFCSGWSEGHWPAVEARFLRIEWFGHNGSEKNEPGRNHSDLIVGKIQLYGPNRLPITPEISEAQAAWADGQVALDDARGGLSSVETVIDDSLSAEKGFGWRNQSFITNPGNANLKKLPVKPAAFCVTLKHTSLVEAVGYASVAPPRDERPRDLKIFTSPYAIGPAWELQKELHDIAGGADEEIVFDRPVRAKRVKFVVERVWNLRADAQHTAGGYMAELYVYGTALSGNVPVTLAADAITSASVFDSQGRPQRTLWQLRAMKAGSYVEEWDGLTDACQEAPAGHYEVRLVTNAGRYENVAAIGNSGLPPTPDGHVPMSIQSVAVDADGAVFSANGWDEAGHDWKKWDRDGHAALHANFQIRNGDPNGMPYRVAVDDRFLYAAYIAHHGEGKPGSQWIHRVDRLTGKTARFEKAFPRNGLIQVYPPPSEASFDQPITDLALSGDLLLVGDRRANRVVKYDKATGQRLGEFGFQQPGAMTVDSRGRLWIVQNESAIVVVDAVTGSERGRPLTDLGQAVGLSFAPGGLLYVADRRASQVAIYQVDDLKATLPGATGILPVSGALGATGILPVSGALGATGILPVSGGSTGETPVAPGQPAAQQVASKPLVPMGVQIKATRIAAFGQPARPGDHAAERFYELVAVAAGPDGCPVTVERFPVGGSRISKWPARFEPARPLWTHLGLEFTGNANYSSDEPDVLVSNYFQRYQLDKRTGGWEFRGNLFRGGNKGEGQWHGVPRWVTLGGQRFFYFANGDGVQAYRLNRAAEQTSLDFVMAVGGREPDIEGKHPRDGKLGQWTWTDANGNRTVDESEVRWFKKPGEGRYAVFGMNVDTEGNILYCDHHTRAIWMLPMAGLNAAANPCYDWSQAKILVEADAGAVKFFPVMAVRTERGDVYAFGRSDSIPAFPGSGVAWMGGWTLAKFDRAGSRQWVIRLAQHCTGMDYVPGDGGVVLGHFEKAVIYHYNRDGLLVGSARPGPAAGEISGWLDNTSAVACNRDPRDGRIDVFAEEDYAHRILWYRLDDSRVTIQKQPIEWKGQGSP